MANETQTQKPATAGKSMTFRPWGTHGITYALEKGALFLRVDLTPQAIKGARMSSTGKNKLVASSGGMVAVPDAPAGLRVNVSAIVPPDAVA